MAGNVVKPQLVIPTQYAPQQQSIAQKRKLAEAMLSQGLSADPNMRNWMQVLGKLGQTWVGKSMDTEATKMEGDLNQTIYDDYNKRNDAFDQQTATMTPQQVVQTFGRDPMLADRVKPFEDAMARALIEREKLIKHNGRVGVRQGDAMGQVDNDPQNFIMQGSDGQTFLNEPRVAAAGIASGAYTPQELPQTTGQMPGVQRLIGAMSGQQPPPASGQELPPVQPEEGVVPGVSGIVNGQRYYIVNGRVFDNPEGR